MFALSNVPYSWFLPAYRDPQLVPVKIHIHRNQIFGMRVLAKALKHFHRLLDVKDPLIVVFLGQEVGTAARARAIDVFLADFIDLDTEATRGRAAFQVFLHKFLLNGGPDRQNPRLSRL